jgi:ADP-L-glycero-D-manno-heptose 6-epimerase
LGTGFARPFISLANAIFQTLGQEVCIHWENTPLKYRDKYQYYTQAEIKKLRSIDFKKHLRSIEPGIKDYIKRYLQNNGVM